MTLKGYFRVEFPDEKWLYLSENSDRCYVAVRLDKPELKITEEYLYREFPTSLSDLESRIKGLTGKNSEELVESGKKIYERIKESLTRYSSFERDAFQKFRLSLSAILLSSSAYLFSTLPFQEPLSSASLLSGFVAGIAGGAALPNLYFSLRETGYLNKNVRSTIRELKEILKKEGIKYKRIRSYSCWGNKPCLKLKL